MTHICRVWHSCWSNGINYIFSLRFRTLDVIFMENRCVIAAPNNKKEMIASRSGQLIFESRREFFERFFDIQMSTGKAPWLSSIPCKRFRSLY